MEILQIIKLLEEIQNMINELRNIRIEENEK